MRKKLLPSIHPGDILREEFMQPLGLSADALARRLGVTTACVNEIVNERRDITADTALMLGLCFPTAAESLSLSPFLSHSPRSPCAFLRLPSRIALPARLPMPFVLRPFRRFPLQCPVTYNAGPFLKLPLAYVSGFWSLITLLFLSAVPACAEWVAVERNYLSLGLQTVYVDPNTIRREGNLVTLWQ